MQAKDFVELPWGFTYLFAITSNANWYMENDGEKKKKQTVVYVELGNNSTVHTQQMHRHTILILKIPFALCCSQQHSLLRPPARSLLHCKTMFTTNFSSAIHTYEKPFLSRWNCFLSNDFFLSLSLRSALLIILAFYATFYELSSEHRFPLSFENDKKHIHSNWHRSLSVAHVLCRCCCCTG